MREIGFEIFFRSMPFVFLGMSYFVFWRYKKWISAWNFSIESRKRLILAFHILIWVFASSWILTFTLLGPRTARQPDFWFRVLYYYPSFVWNMLMFVLFVWLTAWLILKSPYEIVLSGVRFYQKKVKKMKPPEVDQSKRNWLRKSATVLPISLFSIGTIGVYRSEFEHIIERIPIKIQNLPENLKGMTITQVSDIHFGPFMDEKKLSYFVKIINDIKSDFIFLTGDTVNSSPGLIDLTTKVLAGLKAKEGVYNCHGNHEYIAGARDVERSFESAGMPFLVNEARLMRFRGSEFYLVGIDYPSAGITEDERHDFSRDNSANNLKIALSGVKNPESPKILLAHHPDTFLDAQEQGIDLTLSGHTHGGQVVFGNAVLGKIGFRYPKGYYQEKGSQLYVNSGLGHWFPFRWNCPPEITQFILG